MSNHLPKICPACGKEFFVKPSHFERRVACSKNCQSVLFKTQQIGTKNPNYKNSKKITPCLVCGKEITYYPSIRDAKCCSVECSNKYRSIKYCGENNNQWRGGNIKYYGPNWCIRQDATRQRDNYTCQKCGVTEAELGRHLDVHHKKPYRLFSDYSEANHLSNLISLCFFCHKKEEIAARKEYGKPKVKDNSIKIEYLWLTPIQAAEIIGFSVWAVYCAIKRGSLKAKNVCEDIESRSRPRFVIHIDDARAYNKRYSR